LDFELVACSCPPGTESKKDHAPGHAQIHDFNVMVRDVSRDGTSSVGEPIKTDPQPMPMAVRVPKRSLLPVVKSTFKARHDEAVWVLEVWEVDTRVRHALHQIRAVVHRLLLSMCNIGGQLTAARS
jgi:hypothetical protein